MEKNNDEIKNFENDAKIENGPGPIDPMTFMSPEEIEADDKKAEEFIKAFRFGTSGFFAKIKEVYEIEGLRGLKRLETSLDTYMTIRNMVIAEVMESNPDQYAQPSTNAEFNGTEAGEEDTASAE